MQHCQMAKSCICLPTCACCGRSLCPPVDSPWHTCGKGWGWKQFWRQQGAGGPKLITRPRFVFLTNRGALAKARSPVTAVSFLKKSDVRRPWVKHDSKVVHPMMMRNRPAFASSDFLVHELKSCTCWIFCVMLIPSNGPLTYGVGSIPCAPGEHPIIDQTGLYWDVHLNSFWMVNLDLQPCVCVQSTGLGHGRHTFRDTSPMADDDFGSLVKSVQSNVEMRQNGGRSR